MNKSYRGAMEQLDERLKAQYLAVAAGAAGGGLYFRSF